MAVIGIYIRAVLSCYVSVKDELQLLIILHVSKVKKSGLEVCQTTTCLSTIYKMTKMIIKRITKRLIIYEEADWVRGRGGGGRRGAGGGKRGRDKEESEFGNFAAASRREEVDRGGWRAWEGRGQPLSTMAEWLSSWLAEQVVRGSIPRLTTWISEIGYLLLPSRDMAKILKYR